MMDIFKFKIIFVNLVHSLVKIVQQQTQIVFLAQMMDKLENHQKKDVNVKMVINLIN